MRVMEIELEMEMEIEMVVIKKQTQKKMTIHSKQIYLIWMILDLNLHLEIILEIIQINIKGIITKENHIQVMDKLY